MSDGAHPESLRELVAALRAAHHGDPVAIIARHHSPGGKTEWWESEFREYVTGGAWMTTADGGMRHPLRASVADMAAASSETERLAAVFVYLMCRQRFHVRQSWHAIIGSLARPASIHAAEPWARHALARWWIAYRRTVESQ